MKKRFFFIIESKKLNQLSNHPVHLINENGDFLPTALIPFCDLGRNMSAVGIKIDQFDAPVCKIFKAKLVEDQLCYEVDPNNYIDKSIKDASQFDLLLIIDYNEDRQLDFERNDLTAGGEPKIK